jgi:uncharacterized protein (TIRG00374 family)
MSFENLTDNELLPVSPVANSAGSKIGSSFFWVQGIVFLLAFGLLIYVVYLVGLQTIANALKSVGWGFLLIVGFGGARHLLRASCLYLAVPAEHRSFKYRHAIAARLGGEAVNVITFTGPLLGEATKAALLKNRLPLSQGAAAVVADNIIYDISVILLILGGALLMLYTYGGDESVTYVLLGIAVIALLAITVVFLAAKRHIKPLSWIIRKLSAQKWTPRFIVKKQKHIYELEDNVYQFYLHRKRAFYTLFGIDFLAHGLGICEVYVALRLLGHAASPATAYIIESLTKVINLTFSFVPGTVGVYEGGNGVILHSLGYAAAVGVTLGLVRKGAIFFWTFVGLIILLWRTVFRATANQTENIS